MKLFLSVLVFAGLSVLFAFAAAAKPPQPQPDSPAQPATPTTPEAKPVPDTAPVYVKLTTTMGDIYVELNKEKAPISTANFVSYTQKGHYDGTVFHRVIPGFMIQGGGFDKDMKQKKTDSPIKNEWQNGLKNVRGSIAMARTNDPDSATSQFFINVQDNPALDMARPQTGGAAYAVFGRVVSGMDVVDKIKAVRTGTKAGHENVPVEPVVITKAEVVQAADLPGAEGKK